MDGLDFAALAAAGSGFGSLYKLIVSAFTSTGAARTKVLKSMGTIAAVVLACVVGADLSSFEIEVVDSIIAGLGIVGVNTTARDFGKNTK